MKRLFHRRSSERQGQYTTPADGCQVGFGLFDGERLRSVFFAVLRATVKNIFTFLEKIGCNPLHFLPDYGNLLLRINEATTEKQKSRGEEHYGEVDTTGITQSELSDKLKYITYDMKSNRFGILLYNYKLKQKYQQNLLICNYIFLKNHP